MNNDEIQSASKEELELLKLNLETQRSWLGLERDNINLTLAKFGLAGFFLGGIGFSLNYMRPIIFHFLGIGGN